MPWEAEYTTLQLKTEFGEAGARSVNQALSHLPGSLGTSVLHSNTQDGFVYIIRQEYVADVLSHQHLKHDGSLVICT